MISVLFSMLAGLLFGLLLAGLFVLFVKWKHRGRHTWQAGSLDEPQDSEGEAAGRVVIELDTCVEPRIVALWLEQVVDRAAERTFFTSSATRGIRWHAEIGPHALVAEQVDADVGSYHEVEVTLVGPVMGHEGESLRDLVVPALRRQLTAWDEQLQAHGSPPCLAGWVRAAEVS